MLKPIQNPNRPFPTCFLSDLKQLTQHGSLRCHLQNEGHLKSFANYHVDKMMACFKTAPHHPVQVKLPYFHPQIVFNGLPNKLIKIVSVSYLSHPFHARRVYASYENPKRLKEFKHQQASPQTCVCGDKKDSGAIGKLLLESPSSWAMLCALVQTGSSTPQPLWLV